MASFHSGDDIGAVVVDIGTASTRLGWAGDDYPRSYFRSNAAGLRNKDTGRINDITYDYFSQPINGKDDGDWDVINPIDPITGLMYEKCKTTSNSSMNSNNNSTIVPDWYDIINQYIQHSYKSSLPGCNINEHPMLFVERSYNIPAIRQYIVECLFEELNVPATFIAKDAVLACYGCGRTSATVIDCGYSGTTVTPVYDGYVENKGIRRNPIASLYNMDNDIILPYLDKLYYKKKKQKNMYTVLPLYQVRGYNKIRKSNIHIASRLHIARECRHTGAGACINTTSTTTSAGGTTTTAAAAAATTTTGSTTFQAPSHPFELPDGTTLDVPSLERFRAADLLFGIDANSQQVRDTKLDEYKTILNEYIDAINMNDDNEDEMKQFAKDAVGVTTSSTTTNNNNATKRRRTSDRTTSSNNNNNNSKQKYEKWHRACYTQLQTLLDEQYTSASIGQMVCDSAYKCDRDQQATLLGNVILSGGGTCFGPTEQAVPDIVKDHIESIIHQHTPGWRVKVLSPNMQERPILPWIGGSIMASLGTFHEMWISKEEYEEWGSVIVNRKCP